MSSPRRSKPAWQKRIAKERINILMKKAEEFALKKPQYSRRYVQMALKIAMRYNLSIPDEFRKRFCRKCHSFLVPGSNSTVRTSSRQKAVITKCLNCGHVMRYPYRKEKSKKRAAK